MREPRCGITLVIFHALSFYFRIKNEFVEEEWRKEGRRERKETAKRNECDV